MKKTFFIFFLYVIQFSYCQITNEDISKLQKIPKTYQLSVYLQKRVNGKFINDKHTKYMLNLKRDKIISQKIYDTLYHKVVYNKILNYQYNDNKILKIIKITDFKGSLKERFLFNYKEGNLVLKTSINKLNDTIQEIDYQYTKCKPIYVKDNIDDDEIHDVDNLFKCEYKITHNKIGDYKFTTVKVYKIGTGLIKEIELESDKNSPIKRIYTYNYDENFNVRSIDLIKEDTIKLYESFQYNKNNDVIKIVQGNVELFYEYKYDKFNNWTEKIETSKIKSKRRVFKRTFIY